MHDPAAMQVTARAIDACMILHDIQQLIILVLKKYLIPLNAVTFQGAQWLTK